MPCIGGCEAEAKRLDDDRGEADAELDLVEADLRGARRHEADVAHEAEHAAAGEGVAVDRGDGGAREGEDSLHDALEGRDELGHAFAVELMSLGEREAGGERRAIAGDRDRVGVVDILEAGSSASRRRMFSAFALPPLMRRSATFPCLPTSIGSMPRTSHSVARGGAPAGSIVTPERRVC